MMRSAPIVCVAAALGFAAALALASCGGGSAKLLSGTTAEEINSNLARVRELAAEGECVDAEDAALEVSGQVADLREIDPKLKLALQEGAERLNEVVSTCSEETTTTEDTEETEPTTSEEESEKQEKEEEKEQEKVEKEEEKALKDQEKEQEQEESEEEVPKPEQEPPKGKGPEVAPPAGPAGPPSGGIGPGGEAGEGD